MRKHLIQKTRGAVQPWERVTGNPPHKTGSRPRTHAQQGLGMAGFLLVAIPVLSLGLGGAELAHWMSLRQTLSLNLMDAARAGITRQARPEAIAAAFEQSLHRLYPHPTAQSRALARQETLGILWQIRILLPTAAAFADHAEAARHTDTLPGTGTGTASAHFLSTPPHTHATGLSRIRNDYQALQHQQRIAQGWPQGRGPQSGLTIRQANTLALELWWPEQTLLSFTSGVIRALASLHPDPLARRMMHAGYVPFKRSLALPMQSDPLNWPDLPDGRVVHGAPNSAHGPLPGYPPLPTDPASPLPTTPRPPTADTGQDLSSGSIPGETEATPDGPGPDGSQAGTDNDGIPGPETDFGNTPATPGAGAGAQPDGQCAP